MVAFFLFFFTSLSDNICIHLWTFLIRNREKGGSYPVKPFILFDCLVRVVHRFFFFFYWWSQNVSCCAGKLAKEEKIHSFGILRCGRQGIFPFPLSALRVVFLNLTTSYTKSHVMYLFGFLLALYTLTLSMDMSYSLLRSTVCKPIPSLLDFRPCGYMVPSQIELWQAALLQSKSEDCHYHVCCNNLTLAEGGGVVFLKMQHAFTALLRGNTTNSRRWECSPSRGPEGTRAAHLSKYSAFKPFLHFMAWPSQVIRKSALWGSVAPQKTRPSSFSGAACRAGSIHYGV